MERSLKDIEKQIEATEKALKNAIDGLDERGQRRRRMLIRVVKIIAVLVFVAIALPPFYRPINGSRTSGYFFRMRPETNLVTDIEFHWGVDFAAPVGTPIRPSAPGIVESTGWSDSFGNVVVVRHLFGLRTVYAHLSVIDSRAGALVFPGISSLGDVGATGRATGPHLHLEFKIGDRSLPPGLFLFLHNLRRFVIGF